MTKSVVVTGSASGIGAATAALLRSRGMTVIGVDLANCEVPCNLATYDGRAQMARDVERLAQDGLDAVIACAGTADVSKPDLVVQLNYFGAVATMTLLRPLLERSGRGRGVVVASTAALLGSDRLTVEACLSGDEAVASQTAAANPMTSYASSKRAVALWTRGTAILPEWAGCGIALNAVAPGTVRTPMTAALLDSEEGTAMLKQATPIATPGYGEPEDLAEIIAFLATMETAYLTGNILFGDGGTNVLLRPDVI